MTKYESWGKQAEHKPETVKPILWPHQELPELEGPEATMLPFGLGRSYGDSCFNNGNTLLPCEHLDRYISLDTDNGLLTCEAGVSLASILELVVPHGWFLSVTPGTKFVSVGGALANDIHGKNHHVEGTFGAITNSFELLRSDGSRMTCSPEKNEELFNATIGGLGLTGLITKAELRLKKIANPFISMETIKFRNLDDFVRLSNESDRDYEYTVSWIDCSSGSKSVGRGLFMRGNHAPPKFGNYKWKRKLPGLKVPFNMPGFSINRYSIWLFNTLYFNKQRKEISQAVVPYDPFFYPLDAVLDWNRIYGRKGFFQYQNVVPADRIDAVEEIIGRISKAGFGSFLAVLKKFGEVPSPGLLSFPRPGFTLAVDITNAGEKTLKLLDELDEVTRQAGGALYPAKDARMSREMFELSYPKLDEFKAHIDPKFSSDFWRRLEGNK